MKALKPEQLQADVKASIATLRALPEAAGQKVGAVGYCLGGRLAYFSAAQHSVDAAVSYYGGGIQDNAFYVWPGSVKAPMQFHYAENDHAIPLDAVEKVKAATKLARRGPRLPRRHLRLQLLGPPCSTTARNAALAHGRTLQFFAQQLDPG